MGHQLASRGDKDGDICTRHPSTRLTLQNYLGSAIVALNRPIIEGCDDATVRYLDYAAAGLAKLVGMILMGEIRSPREVEKYCDEQAECLDALEKGLH